MGNPLLNRQSLQMHEGFELRQWRMSRTGRSSTPHTFRKGQQDVTLAARVKDKGHKPQVILADIQICTTSTKSNSQSKELHERTNSGKEQNKKKPSTPSAQFSQLSPISRACGSLSSVTTNIKQWNNRKEVEKRKQGKHH